jgi:rod shape-determining protein MreC
MNGPLLAVNRWIGGTGHFFDVYSENQRLREDNARLLQWRNAALTLQGRLKHYQLLLKAAPDVSYTTVTARVIARSSQPFLETVVLDVGKHDGVKPGQAVVDARGLLGRIYAAGERTSWVILLDDLSSRIPVVIRPGNVQAILAGTSASEPNLEALPQNHHLKSGAEVVTSGDGGLLPAGLPVGLLALKGSNAKVSLYADPLAADDVRVVDFSSPMEQMPKPSDKDLPAPDKLKPTAPQSADEAPPPIHKIIMQTGTTLLPAQTQPTVGTATPPPHRPATAPVHHGASPSIPQTAQEPTAPTDREQPVGDSPDDQDDQ